MSHIYNLNGSNDLIFVLKYKYLQIIWYVSVSVDISRYTHPNYRKILVDQRNNSEL